MHCSVIIPTLNEAMNIAATIAEVRALDRDAEVIVADGGSLDATCAIAEAAGAQVVHAPRGRGTQLNAGAAQATGELLIFLHADTALPVNAFALLRTIFADPTAQVAKFRLQFDVRDPMLDLAARLMWYDSVWSSFGDQCMVIRCSFFAALGGFPAWPLFEDVRLFELARARTQVRVVPACVTTSARRFQRNGVFRQLLSDVWMLLRYLLGVPPSQLAREYAQGWPTLGSFSLTRMPQ